jgi:hypothetical protein
MTTTHEGGYMQKKVIMVFVLAAIFSLVSITSPVMAAEKSKAAPAKAATGKAAQVNAITQSAMKAGVKTCAPRVDQVTNFIAAGVQNAGAIMFLPSKNVDKQMVSLSLEIPLKNNPAAYASTSFAPDQANGCAGMYETVVYWPQKCSEVAEKQFGSFRKAGSLAKDILVREGAGQARVFLMPAGSGCVAIKKQIVR